MINVSLSALMIALLAVSYSDALRARALASRSVRALEGRLAGLAKWYWPAFALIMAAGCFARCYRFGTLPGGLNQDGVMLGAETYCLLMDGVDLHGVSWPTYLEAWEFAQMSPLYAWMLLPFYMLLGVSRISLRLPMLLISVAMLPVMWDMARRIAGRGYALLALFALAVNPWHILQSRWALDCNIFPHVFMLGAYFLVIGIGRRWALYLSMLFFGLSVYGYGLAVFALPVMLIAAAVYLVARGKCRVWDAAICAALFAAVAGPFYVTMMINALGWETVTLGPITMPFLEKSVRSNDLAITNANPLLTMARNMWGFFDMWLTPQDDGLANAIPWAHAMYRFTWPLVGFGAYRLWRDRRALAARGEESGVRDGSVLIFAWLAAGFTVCMMTGVNINRANIVFYPLIMIAAYALLCMGRRMRAALAAALVVLAGAFVCLNITYFTDEEYQANVAREFRVGLQEALADTWDWDYDRYYLSTTGGNDRERLMRSQVMFAHRIDYSQLTEQEDLIGPDGEHTDWYFTERYVFTPMESFEPDPMECAVYILTNRDLGSFHEKHYIITQYGPEYYVAYPRYWAQ